MAGTRIANPATRDETHETEQPAVVEWNAKRRRLILRVFNTKTVDGHKHEATRDPTPLSATESPSSPDHDAQVAVVGSGDRRYQLNSFGPQPSVIDTQNDKSASAFQSNGLALKSKQFEPGRTVVAGEDYKRNRADKPAFDSVVGNTVTNTGRRLERNSISKQGVDLGAQYRAYVIETRPNFQSNESETVEYYGRTKRNFLQRPDHNRKSSRVHDASAFLVHPGTVTAKRYPVHLNRVHKNKGSVDYLPRDERLQRKRDVRESPLLESVTFDPLDRDTIEWIILDPLNYRARVFKDRAAERRGTMNKFPSKRPSTPENLKDLSAKHYLKTLRGKDAETELRRNQQTSEVRRLDLNSPEDLVEEEDDYTDSRTVSTRSSSTVYLIRNVKKPNRNGSNGRTHAKKAEPESTKTVEPHHRREILEPVTLKGDPDEKDTGKRVMAKKTKRVKDSVTQTSEDLVQDDTPVAVENKQTMPRFITPRKQKRSVGLQTVIEDDLREQQASFNPEDSSPIRIIRPSKTTIAIQTDIPKTSKSTKTTIGTQTAEPETASKATSVDSLNRGQKEKHDFSGQTENLPMKTTFDEKISEREQTQRVPPLRQSQEAPDVIWPTPTIQPLQCHDTKREDIQSKMKPDTQQALTTIDVFTDNQDQLVYGLQHEVRLLRHENYYLRQQMDYPIKPKGRLQRQNEEKILQIIRHLESQGTTGKLTSQIEEEMMHEAMIENEILRSENSDLHATLDQTRRLQETLTTENEQLRKEIHLQQHQQQQQQKKKMALHGVDDDRHMVEPDDYFNRSQTSEADEMEASRSMAPRSFTIRQRAAESVPMATTGPLRTHAASQQTRIPKLTSDGRLKKSEMRN